MKKTILIAIITLLALGTTYAQSRGNWPSPAQEITVEGTLQFQNGQIVLDSGTSVYFVPAISRFVGFIDGLREGARVSVEGYNYGNSIHATKLTIAGRVYDFPDPFTRQGLHENAHGWRQHQRNVPQRQQRGRW